MENVQIFGRRAIGGKVGKLNSSKAYSIESRPDGVPTVFLHILLSLQPRSGHLQSLNSGAMLPSTYS